MNQAHLEDWAQRAVEQLQENADAAEEAGCSSVPEHALIAEYEAIAAGREPWQAQMGARGEITGGLDSL